MKQHTTEDLLDEFMGVIGTPKRDEFERKVKREAEKLVQKVKQLTGKQSNNGKGNN